MNKLKPLAIGSLQLEHGVMLAPMAGVSDRAFRQLAREAGAALTFTEMVSAQALVYNNRRTGAILDLTGEPGPVGVQLFGSSPEAMARSTNLAIAAGAALIDINMGCPRSKIVKNGEGAALMLHPELAREIAAGVVAAAAGKANASGDKPCQVPVTVKMRKGWDEENINAVELALALEETGVAAITVHARTRSQLYSGRADWDIIRQIREKLKIPVIGNGDVRTPDDAARLLDETGCAGVMVARGAQGQPWVFKSITFYLETGEILPAPTPRQRIEAALRHLHLVIAYKEPENGLRQMRKHLSWYVKTLRGSAQLREKIFSATTVREVENLLQSYAATLPY